MTSPPPAILIRVLRLCLAAVLAFALIPVPAAADPADIDAAARGVVRIIVIGDDDGELYPVSHGTGFAVGPERIVTNAHVVAEARSDGDLSIGIVPSDGGEAVYGRIVAFSSRNDLALIATTRSMNLPPLTIAGNADGDSGGVTSVGYPMNVDRAQGLDMRDIFRAQPPVKSRGFLSGRRPSRDFDTLLHTAPIGRGSSGGPLLDNCGRVVGVNSFGAESDGADSEFYFAVSTRELLPFLRANGVSAQLNGLPCRSLAELDAAERARAQREQLAAQQQAAAAQERLQAREEIERRKAQFAIIAERDNGMMLALVLVIVALGGGYIAWQAREDGDLRKARIAGGIAGAALVAALVAWFLRPGFAEVEERVVAAMAKEEKEEPDNRPSGVITPPGTGKLVCVVDVNRSRITTGETEDIPFTWEDSGCVNGRTQYGLADGEWSRIFVPSSEAVVSINSYDPDAREYRVDRYLLPHDAMQAARKARSEYEAPECGSGDAAARDLGTSQATITALLPSRPNERLVYDCHKAE